MMVPPRRAVPIVIALLAATAPPARADERAQLNACKALVDRAAQSQPASTKPDDAERIRHLRPVVVTGSSDPLANIEARSYGAAICLLKPVDSTTLWRLLIAEGSTQGALTDRE